MSLVRFFYNLAFPFVLVALLPGFLFRMLRRGKYRHKFGQRFAIYSPRVRAKLSEGDWTWVHAVSVGEVLIALKLVRELKRREPNLQVVLSTTTSTGFALASKEKSDWLEAIYNPIDFLWIVRRALRLIRPRRLLLVEAEVWPNLTAEAKAQGATLALVNARLSIRSENRYLAVRPLIAPIFNQLDILCVQEPDDAVRWAGLGVEPGKIVCTGSIKFDTEGETTVRHRDFQPMLESCGVTADTPILLAGSTHSGEERILGQIALDLRKEIPNLFFIVVPRHAERSPKIYEDLEKMGHAVKLRVGENKSSSNSTALLVNTTGELRDWYDYATVVFVGKSLTARGGQNPAEAVAAGKAVVYGPHMENFATLSAQFVRTQGVIQAIDVPELETAIRRLLSSPEERQTLAANGGKCLESHLGATSRTCELLANLVSPSPKSLR
ncbi:3-deoxy-D-manno-octulosonic acid transferase [soil metagenome]